MHGVQSDEVLIFSIVLLVDFGVLYGLKCVLRTKRLLCFGYNLYNRKEKYLKYYHVVFAFIFNIDHVLHLSIETVVYLHVSQYTHNMLFRPIALLALAASVFADVDIGMSILTPFAKS